MLIAPGGSGKTLLASTVMRDATVLARKPLRCFFLVDRNCLVDQTIAELKGLGLECEVLQGSRGRSKKAKEAIAGTAVVVASLQTIAARAKKTPLRELLGNVGLFVADECHTTSQHSAYALLEAEYQIGTIFLGLTGSPWLMSPKKWLGQKFDATVVAPSGPELVRLGRVVPARCFSPGGVFNVSELDTDARTGDFNEHQMEEQLTRKASLAAIVREYKEKGEGRSFAAYCPTVLSAKKLAEEFNADGIAAEWQSGETPLGIDGFKEHQEGILTRAAQNYRLDAGITKIVCSVGTMTTGWNLNSLGGVIFARETKSRVIFFQSAWRGSRTCDRVYWADGPKQNYILLDFGGNLERFGTSPNAVGVDPSDYDISEKRQRKPPTDYEKVCPECETVVSMFSRICPNCNHEFNPTDKGDVDQPELDLDFELKEWFDPAGVEQVQFLRKRKRQCYRHDLSPDIADEEFRMKYGFIAPRDWHFGSVFGNHYDPRTEARCRHDYESYLDRHTANERSREMWKRHHLALEFGVEGKKGRAKPDFASAIPVNQPWYRVLGVPSTCTKAVAKKAYLALIGEWHPDVCGHAIAAEKSKTINAAWDEAKKVCCA